MESYPERIPEGLGPIVPGLEVVPVTLDQHPFICVDGELIIVNEWVADYYAAQEREVRDAGRD